jgi:hypothetical protein
MQKPSHRILTAVAGALGALVLALPLQSSADWNGDRGDNYKWGTTDPHAQRSLDYDDFGRPYYREPSYGYGQGQRWQNRPGHDDWSQERQDRRRDWHRLQYERQEMEEARRQGDWDRYRHEKQEAKEAARALHHHQHHDWDD